MHTQTASYTLVFTDQKGEPLEFQHKDYSELAVLTTELQQHCGWGILSPAKIPDGSVEVTLYREFRVCADDLTLAKAGNPRSKLLTAIVELPGELIHVAGILQNYETTPNFDVTLIDHILAPTTQTALS